MLNLSVEFDYVECEYVEFAIELVDKRDHFDWLFSLVNQHVVRRTEETKVSPSSSGFSCKISNTEYCQEFLAKIN